MRPVNRLYLLAGASIAGLIAIQLLPDNTIGGWLFAAVCLLLLIYTFVEIGWQLFKDARRLLSWITTRLRRGRSDERTTPDRNGR
ncbi:MAG: hypothetical protein FJX11_13250 [Alphaproteobacteria bacterium]|nr:hypothetical protein [Alphaproteobacteria bacterium]